MSRSRPASASASTAKAIVRIALVENEQRIRQAARNIRRFLETAPEKLHNVVPLAKRALNVVRRAAVVQVVIGPWFAPLRVGLAGLGTVGAAVVRSDRARARRARGALRPADRGRPPSSARPRRRIAALDLSRLRMVRRSGRARARSRHRRVRRADRRRRAIRPRARSRRRSRPASRSSPPTRRCSPSTASRSPQLAEKNGVALNFEAAVAGGIPIVKTLREGLAGNAVTRVYGILNGTCNYILTRMERRSCPSPTASKDAQRLGYAEADPTFDIGGYDTAHKLAILDQPRLRHRGRRRRDLCRGHRDDHARGPRGGRRARLPHQAARRRAAHRERASSSACIRPWCRRPPPSPQVMGVTNAVAIDAEVRADHAGRARRRRRRDRSAVVADIADIARGVRAAPFGRPGAKLDRQPAGADAAPRGRLLHPARRGRPARRLRGDRAAHGRRGDLARIDRAAPPRRAAARRRRPKSPVAPAPVILITYATTEDAVRRALEGDRETTVTSRTSRR